MKNILCLIFISASYILNTAGQITSPIRVNAGDDLYERIAKEVFLYPKFEKGTVFFRDGRMSVADLNYNRWNSEMQFVNEKGDTLSISNEATIKYISVAQDSFFYDEGYLQLLASNAGAKAAKKQSIKIVDQQKIGAYDQPSATAAITSYTSFSNDLRTYKIDIRQDIILSKQTIFYMGDKFNHFFKANKKNLLKNFPKKETELTLFLKENNIDFNKEEDILKLVKFLKDY